MSNKKILFFSFLFFSSHSVLASELIVNDQDRLPIANSKVVTAAKKIQEIQISGNKRISNEIILNILDLKIGDICNANIINQSLKKLYKTKFFDEATEISFSKGILFVNVQERLFIKKVSFKGNSKLKTTDIEKELSTKTGGILSNKELAIDIKKIKQTYHNLGIVDSIVNPKIAFRENYVDIVFEIVEGAVSSVKKVTFLGNKSFNKNVLQNIINTQAKSKIFFLNSQNNLNEYKLEMDKNAIEEYYKIRGFLDCRVLSVSALLAQGTKDFEVIFSIDEGAKYNFKDFIIKTDVEYLTEAQIRSFLPKTRDIIFGKHSLESFKILLLNYLNSKGYALVKTDINEIKDGNNYYIELTLTKAPINKIDKIEITGNVRTEDGVIRDAILLVEGDSMNDIKLHSSKSNIKSMGFFGEETITKSAYETPALKRSKIDRELYNAKKGLIDELDTSHDSQLEDGILREMNQSSLMIQKQAEILEVHNIDIKRFLDARTSNKKDEINEIRVNVTEKSTTGIGIQAAYDSVGGFFTSLSLNENNLFGLGNKMRLAAQLGKSSRKYSVNYIEPDFHNRDFALFLNGFYNQDGKSSGFTSDNRKSREYASSKIGGSIGIKYDITSRLSHDIKYNLMSENQEGEETDNSSIYRKENLGKFITSSISNIFTYNRLHDFVSPGRGYVITGTQNFAGVGGDIKYLKHEINARYQHAFWYNKLLFELTVAAGHMTGLDGQKVKINNRFNLGDYTLRGFESIGPKAKGDNGSFLGGQKYYRFSGEIKIPIVTAKTFNLKGVLFCDNGSLWDADSLEESEMHNDKSLRSSIGFGILVNNPALPFRIDWGFPLTKKDHDTTQKFHLNITSNL